MKTVQNNPFTRIIIFCLLLTSTTDMQSLVRTKTNNATSLQLTNSTRNWLIAGAGVGVGALFLFAGKRASKKAAAITKAQSATNAIKTVQFKGAYSQKDASTVYTHPELNWTFCALFNGYTDVTVSNYLQEQLVKTYITKHLTEAALKSPESIQRALTQAFLEAHAYINSEEGKRDLANSSGLVGSTVIACLLYKGHAFIANVGDLGAVLCSKDLAVPLSTQHLTTTPREAERLTSEGNITADGNMHNQWHPQYLDSNYKVSRSFGMPCFAGSQANPEIRVHSIIPEDQFIVLGSQGLWDNSMDNQERVGIVIQALKESPNNYLNAATALMQHTKKRTTAPYQKNTTIMIIPLQQ